MSNISEQIHILVDVQEVEMEILHTTRKIDALSHEAASLDNEVVEKKAGVDSDRQTLDDLKKTYRLFESESRDNGVLIDKSNEKLRVVKTNKEYQSILKEIEDIQKKNSEVEDRMLEHLEQIESAEKAISEKEDQLAAFIQSCQEKKETIAFKGKDQQQIVDDLTEKKMKIAAKAEPKMIAILDDVRKKVRGKAVVPVQGAICSGCNMNIPAQLFNELQRFDELRFCPHCHRIIFWREKEKRSE